MLLLLAVSVICDSRIDLLHSVSICMKQTRGSQSCD